MPPTPETAEDDRERSRRERGAIDASCRVPVLYFTVSAVFWLVLGSFLGSSVAAKFVYPDFLTSSPELTFGRLRMAHLQAVGIGWSSLSGMAMGLWMMCRLSRTTLPYPGLLVVAGTAWNIGMLLDVVGIVAGDGTSVEWLEAPPYSPPFLLFGVGLVSAWTVATFRRRRERHVYVSQWYIMAAVFWFPWMYTVTQMMIFWYPTKGVTRSVVNWWFGHNYLGLWLTPFGLGAAYYLIPKIIGRPVHSYYLSIIGFWSLALFYSWAGMHHLIGGPIPAWLATASTVGSVMMLIPVISVAINHHMTMRGHFHRLKYSPALRFTVFGAMSYTLVSVQGSLEALKDFSEVTHFTHYTVAHAHLGMYGFYTMTMFGAIYYFVPRLTGREWASARLIRIHFWCAAVGISIYFVSLSVGGWWQGRMQNNPNVPWANVLGYLKPYLWERMAAGILMTVGHAALATSLILNLTGWGVKRAGGPTYFVEPAEEPTAKQSDVDRMERS